MSRVGLGLRREIAMDILEMKDNVPDFLELAPENWIDVGGYWGNVFSQIAERYSFTAHGLSLSIGSPDPINFDFLKKIKTFLDTYNVEIYSEHLAFSTCDNAHIYESLPVPFTEEALKHIVSKIKTVQDFLERPLCLENITYYTVLESELTEAQFLSTMAQESGCNILLDVNNIYVNGKNQDYSPKSFIEEMDLSAVNYIHIGGHEETAEGLILDTHGERIIDPVYDLFEDVLAQVPDLPVLLERDSNFEDFSELVGDMTRIRHLIDAKKVNV